MDEKLLEQFDRNEENQKLLNLYESKNYREVIAEIVETNKKVGGKELVLHLPCITGNYKEMDKKILIIGQELDGWREIRDNPKDAMLDTLDISLKKPPKHPRPFNSFSLKFCKMVNKPKFPVSWASANIRKFSYKKTPKFKLHEKVQNLIYDKFNCLEEEIKIIKPDIVLFLTGPYYDYYIKNQLKGVEFKTVENYNIRQFARVEHKSLPDNSFRIYHPRYLKRRGIYNKYLNVLKKECGL